MPRLTGHGSIHGSREEKISMDDPGWKPLILFSSILVMFLNTNKNLSINGRNETSGSTMKNNIF